MLVPFMKRLPLESREKLASVFRALMAIVLVIGLGIPVAGFQFFSEQALAADQGVQVSVVNTPKIDIVVAGKHSETMQYTTTLAQDIAEILEEDYGIDAGNVLSMNVGTVETIISSSEVDENSEVHETTIVKSFGDIVHEPSWTEGALHMLINIDQKADESMGGLSNSAKDVKNQRENIARLQDKDVHLIQWGSKANKAQAEALISKTKGLFLYDLDIKDAANRPSGDEVNEEGTYQYYQYQNEGTLEERKYKLYSEKYREVDETAIVQDEEGNPKKTDDYYKGLLDKFVRYLVDNIGQNKRNNVVYVNEPFLVNVEPANLEDNAVSSAYPAGRWRYMHDPTVYTNTKNASGAYIYDVECKEPDTDADGHVISQGKWSSYSPKMTATFEQPGRYLITFDDKEILEIYAQRRAISDFAFEVDASGNLSFTNLSSDDDQADKVLKKSPQGLDNVSYGASGCPGIKTEKWEYQVNFTAQDGKTYSGSFSDETAEGSLDLRQFTDGGWSEGVPGSASFVETGTPGVNSYNVRLTVWDYQAQSDKDAVTCVKSIGDGNPVASFKINDTTLDATESLDIVNMSYDPSTAKNPDNKITEYEWTLYDDMGRPVGDDWKWVFDSAEFPSNTINLENLFKQGGARTYRLGLVVSSTNASGQITSSMPFYQTFTLSNVKITNSIEHYLVFLNEDGNEVHLLICNDYITAEATWSYYVGDRVLRDVDIPAGFKIPEAYECFHDGKSEWFPVGRSVLQGESADTIRFYYDIQDDLDISYKLNEGTFPNQENIKTTYTPGTEIVIDSPVREGWNFVGWRDDETGVLYTVDESEPTKTYINKGHNIRAAKTRDEAYVAMYGSTLHNLQLSAIWEENIAPDTPTLTEGWTQLDTCEWCIDDNGVLAIRPLGNGDSGLIKSPSPWKSNSSIKSVVSQGDIKVQSCKGMFRGCTNLESADLSNWDLSGATSTELMFYKCSSLEDLNIANWDVSNIESLELMFYRCSSLKNLDLSSWDVSNVQNMESTFYRCSGLESIDVSSWNVSKVGEMNQMFLGCSSLASLDLSSWSISDSTKLDKFLEGCPICSLTFGGEWKASTGSGLWTPSNDGYTGSWVSEDALNPGPLTTAELMESYDPQTMAGTWVAQESVWESAGTCKWTIDNDGVLTLRPLEGEDVGVFDYNESPWKDNTEIRSVVVEGSVKVKNCDEMFSGCVNLERADLSNWDVSDVKSTEMMFYKCTNLGELNVSSWDVSNVGTMELMFYKCSNLTSLDVSSWDVSNVQSMDLMFFKCGNLENLDIASWNVSGVEKMKGLFKECSNLTTLDLSSWDVSNVENMDEIFDDCPLTTLSLGSGWKASSNTSLWTPEGDDYTGSWVSSDAKNQGPVSTLQLMSGYDPESMAGTWTAETVGKPVADPDKPKPPVSAPVTFPPTMMVYASGASTGKVTLAQGKSLGLAGKAIVVKEGVGVKAKGKVSYKSSNAGLVKVSPSGKITANKKKTGTAKITITSADNPANKKVITVKVVKRAKYKAATKILRTSLKAQYRANPSKAYKVTVKRWAPSSPSNKNFIITVSPKSRAKVDPSTNKVTFLKKGTVKVTVKSASDPKAKAVVKVKVK